MKRVAVLLPCVLLAAAAPAQTYEKLHTFRSSRGNPRAGLVVTSDGRLFGTTTTGGAFGMGSVFVLTPQGGGAYAFEDLHSFTGPDGFSPSGPVARAPGGFYGTNEVRGINAAGEVGTVFFLDDSGRLTTLHAFSGAPDGGRPIGALLLGPDGFVYGTTSQGGDSGLGTVFRMDASGALAILHSFSGPDGWAPNAGLIRAADGNFYGTTLEGGANDGGVVYRISPLGDFKIVAHLDHTNGGHPEAGLVRATNGYFYGAAASGGAHGWGTIFRVGYLGGLTAVHSFDYEDGAEPRSTLIQASDGLLYGTAVGGGSQGSGTAFRLNPDGSGFETLHEFGSEGRFPYGGLVELPDGNLAGTLQDCCEARFGLVYTMDSLGNLTVVHQFLQTDGANAFGGLMEAADGNFYGTTFGGGRGNSGTIFRMDSVGQVSMLHEFETAEVHGPYTRLLEAADGNLYGTTTDFFYGHGTMFRVDLNGVFATLHHFNGMDGSSPKAALVEGPDGNLYGTTEYGGADSDGTVFQTDLTGNVTTLHSFSGSDGSGPFANLLFASDGNAYGSTQQYSGASGSIFRLDSSNVLTTLSLFTDQYGGSPMGELIQGSDGKLYGTSAHGGSYGHGTVFRMELTGERTTLHEFAGPPEGGGPRAGLVEGAAGEFYGVTGTAIFRISANGQLGTLHEFSGEDGGAPWATLLRADDGDFYGTVAFGGGPTWDDGAVFRYSNAIRTPSLGTIFPSSGRANRGTSLTITGTHLRPNAEWTIGGAAVAGAINLDHRTEKAVSPLLPPGTVNDLVVTNPDSTTATMSLAWFADFLDVDSVHLFHDDVESIVRAGIAAGCGGGNYCVNAPVTRAQMAVFLLKAEHGAAYSPSPCTGVFADVACPGPFTDWIEQLAAEGVTSGCGGGNYCPGNAVPRAQMAVFLLKTLLGSAYAPPVVAQIFNDVPPGAFAYDFINDLFTRGITGGCGGGNYCPGGSNTRGQMAVFLVNTFGL